MNQAGVLVLYNPDIEVVENIYSWIDDVSSVYLVDNSSNDNKALFTHEKIHYIKMKKNVGLCAGLNIGCKKAISDGADYLLTLNQDTWVPKGTVKKLFEYLERYQGRIVVGPNYRYIYREEGKRIFSNESAYSSEENEVNWIIMAGTVFTARAFLESGGFDEKLFIDELDKDFCLRLNEKGYKIFRIGGAYIFQEPGNMKKMSFLGKIIHIPNLNSKRYYYIFRNERYLRNKWGDKYRNMKTDLYKYICSILFFEDDKMKKTCACIKGWQKGKYLQRNNYGGK